MTAYNDDDLRMIRLQEGDRQAFDEIVSHWQGPLFGFFVRNTRDRPLSEDLVQESLLRLYRGAWDYLPGGQFRGWLFRIARNLLIDQTRRASRDALVRRVHLNAKAGEDGADDLLELLPDDLLSPLDRTADAEIAEIVSRLLDELPVEQRQTFTLHHYDSLTLSEVADAMNTSLPTAKSRLRLAKEKLRYQLTCRGFSAESSSQ